MKAKPTHPEVPLAEPFSAREIALEAKANALVERAASAERQLHDYVQARAAWRAGTQFVVAIPICWQDVGLALRMLAWSAKLGRQPFKCVLGVPHNFPGNLENMLKIAGREAFEDVLVVSRPFALPDESWPIGPNWSFACLAQTCFQRQVDFLLLEPDCVPLKARWLSAIEREYRGCGHPYMGFFEPAGAQHDAHMAGNAVYNWDVYSRFNWIELWKAWDVAIGPKLRQQAHCTPLIQQVWGDMHKPPTFPNAASLTVIKPDAVLFHRSKDGTLIDRLEASA